MMRSKTLEITNPAARAASALRQEIREGKFSVGERLANERLLSKRFGISRGTIRQALKILESERLISRQQGRGTFVANPQFAPMPAGARAALIGALVSEKEAYFGSILQAASSESAARGYMLTTGSNETQDAEEKHVDALLRSGIQGVVFAPRPQWS